MICDYLLNSQVTKEIQIVREREGERGTVLLSDRGAGSFWHLPRGIVASFLHVLTLSFVGTRYVQIVPRSLSFLVPDLPTLPNWFRVSHFIILGVSSLSFRVFRCAVATTLATHPVVLTIYVLRDTNGRRRFTYWYGTDCPIGHCYVTYMHVSIGRAHCF